MIEYNKNTYKTDIEKELNKYIVELDLYGLDDYNIYVLLIEYINLKLEPIGLNVSNIELKYNTLIENIEIEISDIDKYYNYFFNQHDYRTDLKPIYDQIRESELFKEQQEFYGVTIKEYIQDMINDSFNDPYYQRDFCQGYYINKEISQLNNDLLGSILNTIGDFFIKAIEN